MPRKEPPLRVEVPEPGREVSAWSRVGIIGVAGLVIGLVWPRLLGISVGPDAPGADQAVPETETNIPVIPPKPEEAAEPPPAAGGQSVSNKQRVVIAKGVTVACFTDKDKADGKDCDSLRFDKLAKKKLNDLAKCPSAIGLEGELLVGLDVDFKRESVTVFEGEDSDLPGSTVRGVLRCAGKEFEDVQLNAFVHKHDRYKIHFKTRFYPPGTPIEQESAEEGAQDAASGEGDKDTALGTATVSWDTALVRKKPKDGEVVARLLRGTRVKLLEQADDWYKIDAGTATGWVYKQSIGLE